ncbi:MAG: DUF1810 domain-containing protein [Novosphingobium sp.]|nr:DUF1810 domain-containing protein [Novosphingobium sp.]
MSDLGRFLLAQDGTYPAALAELRAGAKRGYWMWFVFPQIAGLGRSPAARHFAIRDLDEARAYLAHDLLGARLHETTAATVEWAGKRTLTGIFGQLDAIKFVSCMTLFEAAANTSALPFANALDALAQGGRDSHTLALLALDDGSC